MKRTTLVIIQCVGVSASMLIPMLPVDKQWMAFCATVPAVVQLIAAILAQNFNPDGSDASIPYRPTIKPQPGVTITQSVTTQTTAKGATTPAPEDQEGAK